MSAVLVFAALSPALVIGLIVGISAPLVSFIIAARRFSGKIQTTEAAALWEEAGKLREEYRLESAGLRARLVACEGRIAELEHINHELLKERDGLEKRVAVHEKTIQELHSRVKTLTRQNKELNLSNVALRKRITEIEEANGHDRPR